MANFRPVSSVNTLHQCIKHNFPGAVNACRALNTPEWPSVVHRCSDAPPVACVGASHHSGSEVGFRLPLTQSMWRCGRRGSSIVARMTNRQQRLWNIFGAFLDLGPDGSRCQVRSAITVSQRAPESETPTGGALYACEMQPFPRRLMKRLVENIQL